MRSKRRIDRDRARREPRARVRDAPPRETEDLDIPDLDPAIARALMGYDE